jgi:hypothetical protein
VRAFDSLDVKVQVAGRGVGADRGIAAIGEWAGLSRTETCDVVLVPTEGLVFGSFKLEGAFLQLATLLMEKWTLGELQKSVPIIFHTRSSEAMASFFAQCKWRSSEDVESRESAVHSKKTLAARNLGTLSSAGQCANAEMQFLQFTLRDAPFPLLSE